MYKRGICILLALTAISIGLKAQEMVTIHGQVSDFQSHPIDSVTIKIKDKSFNDLYTTRTDKEGHYSLKVPKGRYYCLYAINPEYYGKTKLEYWAWNIPAFKDLEVNPQYERMEIYGINVFETQVKPFDSYMIYFRPMSLTKALKHYSGTKEQIEKKAAVGHDTIDISPQHIAPDELTVRINNQEAKVLQIQKVTEYARGSYMYGYLIQVKKDIETNVHFDIDQITVILHSKETNEKGRADCFYEKVAYPRTTE